MRISISNVFDKCLGKNSKVTILIIAFLKLQAEGWLLVAERKLAAEKCG